ncbi:adenosylcobinamide-GDP ribazoletransferase [Rhizobium oryzicola]|uniref:adenosylcobinamide-GDP ribazoletransferase n=1 Tax=Rhizobium oryzicola TaxID=1232668 RepID=UPI00345C14EF
MARSVAFLSRLPVPSRFFEGHDGSVARACRAFPVAGALIALPSALILLAMADKLPLVAALLAIGLSAALCGALHEDGFADSVDGLGGGRDKDHALTIMKDSRTGAYGVIALILSFGLRTFALASLATLISAHAAAAAFIAAATVGRALMIWHWSKLPPARQNGTAVAAGQPQESAVTFAIISAIGLMFVLLWPQIRLGPLLFAFFASLVAVLAFTRFVRRKIGGHSGDTIGGSEQLVEITFLVALAALA